MSRKLSIVLLLLALAGGSAFASKVTNVELAWQDGFTVATVSVDGPVRFSHQTEEAKEGKPFRVILDVLSATHHLGAKNFFRLPASPVAKLRTSQFAVKPEKVVRLVFDMSAETVYKINADKGVVKVYFPDKNGKAFASWTSSSVVAAMKKAQSSPPKIASTQPKTAIANSKQKTAAQINAEINADRMAALQSSTHDKVATPQPKKSTVTRSVANTPKKVSKPVVKKHVPQLAYSGEAYGPEFDEKLLNEAAPVVKKQAPAPKVKSQLLAKAEPKKKATKTVTKKQAPVPKVKSQLLAKAEPKKKATKTVTKKTPSVESSKKPVVVAKTPAKKVVPSKPEAKLYASTTTPVTPYSVAPAKTKTDSKVTKKVTQKTPAVMKSRPTVAKKSAKKQPKKAAPTVAKKSTKKQSKKAAPTVAKKSTKKQSKKAAPTVAKQSTKKQSKKAAPTVAKKSNNKQSKKAAPTVAKKSKKKSGAKAQPTVVKADKSAKKSKSTARFRRSPTRPTKIKGTLVAEFPKRLVIKYKARNRRDPFETLINESKLYDSPVGKRLANVEGLRLVGVIESGDRPNQALVEDEGGYGHILKEGDKVQKGYVLRVAPEKVYFQIFEYGWSRTVALNLDPNK